MNILTRALQGFLQVLFAGVLSELRQLREEVTKMGTKQAAMAETQKTNQEVLIEEIGILKTKQDAMFLRVKEHQDADALANADLKQKLIDLQLSHGNSPQLEAAIGVVDGMIKADDEFDPAAPVETGGTDGGAPAGTTNVGTVDGTVTGTSGTGTEEPAKVEPQV